MVPVRDPGSSSTSTRRPGLARELRREGLELVDGQQPARSARAHRRAGAHPLVGGVIGALVHGEGAEALAVGDAGHPRDAAGPDPQSQRGVPGRAEIAAGALLDVGHGHDHALQAPATEGGDQVLVDVEQRRGAEGGLPGQGGEAHADGAVHRPRRRVDAPLSAQAHLQVEQLGDRNVAGVVEGVLDHQALDGVAALEAERGQRRAGEQQEQAGSQPAEGGSRDENGRNLGRGPRRFRV